MDFIFMLSRNDRTVSDCLHVIDLIESLGLRDIGFKDAGVTEATAGGLVNRIKARGATSYMEVVSTTPQAVDRSNLAQLLVSAPLIGSLRRWMSLQIAWPRGGAVGWAT